MTWTKGQAVSAHARAGAVLALLALFAGAHLCGCVRRTIGVTSEPLGASVTVNDVPVGRTPLEFDFTYHGVYDVVFEKAGFEPLRMPMRTDAPLIEYPPFDLAALAWPGGVHTEHRWHVKMVPSLESGIESDADRLEFERRLMERAKVSRERVGK